MRAISKLLVFVFALNVAACSQDPEVAKRKYAESGDRFAAEGKFKEAIIEYRQALSYDDRFGEARAKLGKAYIQTGEPQRALREYVRAADLLNDADTHLQAGQLLLIARRFEDAKDRADKALAVAPGRVEALILKGSAMAGLRDVDGALREVETAIAEEPMRAEGYAVRGTLQQVQGDTKLAEQSFLEGIKAQPASVPAHLALANFYWRTGRLADAELALNQARKLAPQDSVTNRFAVAFYLSTGKEVEAEAPLKIIADATPGIDAQLRLADFYARVKKPEEAKKILEALMPQDDAFVRARLQLATITAAEGDREKALTLIEEALGKQRQNTQAHVAKTLLLMDEGRRDDALAAAKEAVAADANSAPARYVSGKAHSLKGDNEAAESEYEMALKLRPTYGAAMLELARIKLALAKPDHAAQLLDTLLKIDPADRNARLLRVRALLQLDQLDEAERALSTLTASYPDAPAVNTELGRLMAVKGNYAKARPAFERALKANGNYVPALTGIISLDLREKRHVDARRRVDAAIAAHPTNGDLRLLAARVYQASNDPAAAERALIEAINVAPNNLRAYGSLAAFYAAQNRLPDATRELEKLAARRPADAATRTSLGLMLEMQQKVDDAQKRYQEALEINPRSAVAANNLAWLYAERGERLDVALQLARSAKAELPESHEVSDTLGWVYYKSNMPAMAVAPFQEAVTMDPNNAAYHLHLGLAYAKTGEPGKAREAVEKAVKLNPGVAGLDEARAALEAIGQRLSR